MTDSKKERFYHTSDGQRLSLDESPDSFDVDPITPVGSPDSSASPSSSEFDYPTVNGMAHHYRDPSEILGQGRYALVRGVSSETGPKMAVVSPNDDYLTPGLLQEVRRKQRFMCLYYDKTKDQVPLYINGNTYRLVEEYIEGTLLTETLIVDLKEYLDIAIKLVQALAECHSKGMIHCDLKSDNVVLGKTKNCFLMDGGSFKFKDEEIRFNISSEIELQKFRKNYWHLAPECSSIINEKRQPPKANEKMDIFSLGHLLRILLWQVQTSKTHPISLVDLIKLQGADLTCPEELDDLIRECCAKDPDSRPTILEIYIRLQELQSQLLELPQPSEVTAGALVGSAGSNRDNMGVNLEEQTPVTQSKLPERQKSQVPATSMGIFGESRRPPPTYTLQTIDEEGPESSEFNSPMTC